MSLLGEGKENVAALRSEASFGCHHQEIERLPRGPWATQP
jgi:hypothetical protein